jgi:hypothetical protein
MLAFEVSLNGKVLYTARIGDTPVVSTSVRALELPQWGMRLWWRQQPLVVGDAVTVRIVDVDETDEPSEMSGPGMLRSSGST